MNELVQLDKNSNAFITTLIISSQLDVEHRAVMKLIKSHSKTKLLSNMIPLHKKGKHKPTKYFDLTFNQSLFVLSLMKNTKRVLLLKSEMILRGESILLSELIASFDVEEIDDDKYIYVAMESETGRYKIGISKDPERRVKELNTGNPEQLILVHAYLAIDIRNKSETLAHAVFVENRLKGEWFNKHILLSKLPSYSEE